MISQPTVSRPGSESHAENKCQKKLLTSLRPGSNEMKEESISSSHVPSKHVASDLTFFH